MCVYAWVCYIIPLAHAYTTHPTSPGDRERERERDRERERERERDYVTASLLAARFVYTSGDIVC